MNQRELLYLKAKREYYNSDSPIMSDSEFDALEQELISEGSSVVNKVGAELSEGLTKVKHSVPMKSLNKIKIDDKDFEKNLLNWIMNNNISGIEASVKLDGNAVKLVYNHKGEFMVALTRGNGEVGLDISDKLVHMGIPEQLNIPQEFNEGVTVEVLGEVVIDVPTFEKEYAEDFKNPRNFISGRLNIDLSADIGEEKYKAYRDSFNDCDFIGIDVIINNPTLDLYDYMENSYLRMCEWGFKNINDLPMRIFLTSQSAWKGKLNKYIDDIRSLTDEITEDIPYLSDGIVLREMRNRKRQEIGETSHHPKWAVALKFDSEKATTKLIDIEWTVGTNRKLTPVGILEPVELMGTTVQRVSLSNLNTMVKKRIVPQSTVTIQKAGDIIPYVISCTPPEIMDDRYIDDPYKLITNFSDINIEDLEWDEDDPYNVRYGEENDEIKKKKLLKGIKALEIDHIGKATVDKLFDAGIETINDVFDKEFFNVDYLSFAGDFKRGRALEKIVNSVFSGGRVDFWRVINACQFDGCGETMSKELAKYYTDQQYDFSGLEKEVINNLTTNTDYTFIVDMLEKDLLDAGYDIIYPSDKQVAQDNPDVEVKTFEMTGSPKLHGWKTKNDFVSSLSNEVEHTKLTKDTDYLITDNLSSNTSKMKKAKKYGVEIIEYHTFNEKYKG